MQYPFVRPRPLFLLCCLLLAGLCTSVRAQEGGVTAFSGMTLIDGTGAAPVADAVMLVRDGRIVELGPAEDVTVPAGAVSVDLAGSTVIPGLINAHGHAGQDTDEKLLTYARYGVTTVVSLGGENAAHVRQREEQSHAGLNTARLFVAGPVINPGSVAEARREVDRLADMDVDWVKFRIEGGSMPEDVYAAIIERAHGHGLKVAAHMYHLTDTLGLLQHDVDLLAHSVRDQEVGPTMLELMRQKGTCLSPTLMREVSTYVYHETPEFFSDPFFLREADPDDLRTLQEAGSRKRAAASLQRGQRDLRMAMHNLGLVSEAGLPIAMGTDSGAFTGRFPGYFEHMELALMVQAGMSEMATLQAATGMAARCAGLEEVGTLEAGKWADFIVLEANPLDDILNTREILGVFTAGNLIE